MRVYAVYMRICAEEDALIWNRIVYQIILKIYKKEFVDCGIYSWHIFCHCRIKFRTYTEIRTYARPMNCKFEWAFS